MEVARNRQPLRGQAHRSLLHQRRRLRSRQLWIWIEARLVRTVIIYKSHRMICMRGILSMMGSGFQARGIYDSHETARRSIAWRLSVCCKWMWMWVLNHSIDEPVQPRTGRSGRISNTIPLESLSSGVSPCPDVRRHASMIICGIRHL